MIFDPTDFDAPAEPSTNWLRRLFGGRRRARLTPVSELPPRLLEDIGVSRARTDITPRHRR
jgi:hypothetical protein